MNQARTDYEDILQSIIEMYRVQPVDIINTGDSEGEYKYLLSHKDSYVRTLKDVDRLLVDRTESASRKSIRVLEIGAFLGPLSIALRMLNYDVYALDIPEFQQSSSLQALYNRHKIPFLGLNLRSYHLPWEDGFFDIVIMCEVMEHLNFNPLPVLQECNRVLKHSGYIYIGMPNQANIRHRIRLALGKSFRESIEDYFSQLDRKSNMLVGLHWREYTLDETKEMLIRMGFRIEKAYYDAGSHLNEQISIKNLLKSLLYLVPSFRPLQVVIGNKQQNSQYDFWLTEANS